MNKKNQESSKNKYRDDSSDEELEDAYQNAFMSSLKFLSKKKSTQQNILDERKKPIENKIENTFMSSLKNLSKNKPKQQNISDEEKRKPTENRIEFVKNLLSSNVLKPMIDFDNFDTETATSSSLNKKIISATNLFTSMNVKLKYLKSGTTGHTFKAISKTDKDVAFAVKVCAYPKDDYGSMNNMARPENAELRMLRLLSLFVIKKWTPHFVIPIGTFNTRIKHFINFKKTDIDLDDEKNEMYKKFIERYYNEEYEDFVSVLISEWCNGGDLLEYIRKNHENMKLKHWVVIFFQILYTLARVQTIHPSFRHNDMKANNILVQLTNIRPDLAYGYSIEKTQFRIPNINLQIKIWDFDFACISGIIDNNKVDADWTKKINITSKQNKYYDMHYFFNTLTLKKFFPKFYEGGVPPEIIDFVHRIIPERYRNGSKYVNKKGRILVNDEFTTPYKVIMTDPLFEKYRFHHPAC